MDSLENYLPRDIKGIINDINIGDKKYWKEQFKKVLNEINNDKYQFREQKTILSLLANDLRCDFSPHNLKSRQNAMLELCKEIERNDLYEWLEREFEESYFDGRVLRDRFELYGYAREKIFISDTNKRKYRNLFTSEHNEELFMIDDE